MSRQSPGSQSSEVRAAIACGVLAAALSLNTLRVESESPPLMIVIVLDAIWQGPPLPERAQRLLAETLATKKRHEETAFPAAQAVELDREYLRALGYAR